MIAQKIERWTQEWLREGWQKGIVEGEAKGLRAGEARALLRLLEKKFGVVPPRFRNRVQRADLDHLQVWLDRTLTAGTLEQVFSDSI